MTPKERWGRIAELAAVLDGCKTSTVVDELTEHVMELDKIRSRTIEDLQFSESSQINRAADFECDRCGAPIRVTDVTCAKCANKTIEEIAEEKQNAKQEGLAG